MHAFRMVVYAVRQRHPRRLWAIAVCLAVFLVLGAGAGAAEQTVEQGQMGELRFSAGNDLPDVPFDVDFRAVFRHEGGTKRTLYGRSATTGPPPARGP